MKPEEPIFADVQDLPASERAAFLDRVCADDAELRARVDALLRAYDGAGARIEASPVASAASTARGSGTCASLHYSAGMRIGRYRLLEKLGEGGCGVVFMAEQEKPVRRRVALKVIKLGMDTQEVIARFEAERQALALMDHPNIAHVLDADATELGRPFFVMELVRGTAITRYCDEHQVGSAERLNLFMQVCHAIQHAHQKGIIHRDLKPSNILVALHDGVPVPKIIDFGIAKAMYGRLADRTLFTAFEQFVGTPAYMSPEQMEMSGLDVDTRSDIYSLGVLLYELLTGRTPFESQALLKVSLDEMRRTIREVEPVKPSTRVSTLSVEDKSEIARQRGTDPAKLSSWLRGDVDWIVMRCLEKDRTRRYETANGLAMDLQRYLRNEPVLARPPGTAYFVRKLVRRNRLRFAAAAMVLLTLVVGFTLSTWWFVRERTARQRADREAARSAQVARFMQDMLAGVGPQAALGRDTKLLRAILDETVVRMNQELHSQPEVAAGLFETLGRVYRDLGEQSSAAVMHQRALHLRRTSFGREHPTVASSLHELGEVLALQGKQSEAEASLEEAWMMRGKLLGAEHSATTASRTALIQVRRSSESRATLSASDGEPAASRGAPASIRVAYGTGVVRGKPVIADLLSIAVQQRVLEKEFSADGIRVEWNSHPNQRSQNEANARVLADFTSMGSAVAFHSLGNGADYKGILALRQFGTNLCLIVRADSPFRTVADLKGRRLGTGKGYTHHLVLCRILETHGFAENDFEILALDGPAAVRNAFAAGDIVAHVANLDDAFARDAAGPIRVLHDTGRDLNAIGMGKFCVSAEFERRHPEIVQRVVTALVKAAAWVSDERNRAEVIRLWAISPEQEDYLTRMYAGYPLKERASPLMDDSFRARLRRDAEDAQRFGLISADAETETRTDLEPKYLQRALRELNLEDFWMERDEAGRLMAEP